MNIQSGACFLKDLHPAGAQNKVFRWRPLLFCDIPILTREFMQSSNNLP